MSDAASKLGVETLKIVRSKLCVDKEWVVAEEQGFRWWAHRLSQRVWCADKGKIKTMLGLQDVWTVYIETSLFKGVHLHSNTTSYLPPLLPLLNRYASLSAITFDEQTSKVSLRCTVYITQQNYDWMSRFVANAALLQITLAEHLRENPIEGIGIDSTLAFDESPHPISGWRSEPDEMLRAASIFSAFGDIQKNKILAQDLIRFEELVTLPGIPITGDAKGYDLELPYTGAQTAMDEMRRSGRNKASVQTALFQVFPSQHPQLGEGILMLLRLPTVMKAPLAMETLNHLNQLEATGQGHTQFFGAWAIDKDMETLVHCCFLPSVFYPSELLGNFVHYAAVRSKWAASVLEE